MTERHAILTAIRENPSDDTPRLVYADWLEEHGEPERAELIRLQIELARMPNRWGCRNCTSPSVLTPAFLVEECGCSHKDRRADLRKREPYLLGTCTDSMPEELVTKQCPACIDCGPDWETGIVECRQCDCTGMVPNYDRVDFTRGILEELECPWELWRDHGDLIWERELPWKVRLTTRPDDVVLDEWQPGTPNLNPIWRWGFVGSQVTVDFKGGESRDDAIRRLLAARWPGIDFELSILPDLPRG